MSAIDVSKLGAYGGAAIGCGCVGLPAGMPWWLGGLFILLGIALIVWSANTAIALDRPANQGGDVE